MSESCDLSIREAGEQLRNRGLSSVELTESTLRRIEKTEPSIHAYVLVLAEEALTAAQNADAEMAAGRDRGPFHGIPVAIKDIFDVRGTPTKCGSRVLEHAPPASSDAESVARLRDGGAVIVGKTTTQEFAAGVVSPPARNPWDPSRIPGGSSGGSAAALAAGSTLGALGSDTGGSIRIPAALCGVVGLKPTYGTVSTKGVFPLSASLDTVGPLAKTVEDAAVTLKAIADCLPGDPTEELGQDLAGLRLGVPRPHFFDRLQTSVRITIERAIVTLKELGAEIVEAPWTDASAARSTSFLINRVETVAVHGEGIRKTPELYGEELCLRVQANALYPAEGYLRALRARTVIKRSIGNLFSEYRLDALIAPTLPGTAVPADDLYVIDDRGEREHAGLAYTRLTMPFNATGQPALTVPCGFDDLGLPIGLQIVGRPYAEARICRIGQAYERSRQ